MAIVIAKYVKCQIIVSNKCKSLVQKLYIIKKDTNLGSRCGRGHVEQHCTLDISHVVLVKPRYTIEICGQKLGFQKSF